MNGKNKILIGCLALLLVMSMGYALFSDTITINGTATAKGEFELTTMCDMDQDAINATFRADAAEKGSVTDAKITCEDNVVNVSATLGYPGSEKWFRVMIKNTGTIPAKLKQIVELNHPEHMFSSKETGMSQFGIENCKGKSGENNVCAMLCPIDTWIDDYTETDENYWGACDWYDEQFDAVLDPGETAYFYVQTLWNASSKIPGDPLTASLDVEITWEQVTVE